MQIEGLDEFITQFPVFEYRIVRTEKLSFEERVRQICRQECDRYGTTWACPPAVGTVEECKERCLAYSHGLLFSSVAEVSDIMNMQELLDTRMNPLQTRSESFCRRRVMKCLFFPQSPAISVNTVRILMLRVVTLGECTPAWKVMESWSQILWRQRGWSTI